VARHEAGGLEACHDLIEVRQGDSAACRP
jgi:hypothetical protein